jgi:tetratricopeptide (TPR) repeat protein
MIGSFSYVAGAKRPRGSLRFLLALMLVLASLVIAPPSSLATIKGSLAFHQGVAAFGAGDYEAAQEHVEVALAAAPKNADTLQYLGLVARARGESRATIDLFEQSLSIDPASRPARLELAVELLESRRSNAALDHLEMVLESDPDNARALLLRGIALYRLERYAAAIDALDRTALLDPTLATEANYYIGLSEAFRGNSVASSAAFDEVARISPNHPLGLSAAALMDEVTPISRSWSLAATAGVEYSTNVTLAPEITTPGFPPTAPTSSAAGLFRLQGQLRAFELGDMSFRAGSDHSLRIHTSGDASFLDEQTHVVWARASYALPGANLSLRYAFSYSALDLSDSFRTIHRVSPTLNVPVGGWGLAQIFYQFLSYDYGYDIAIVTPSFFDRSGPQHSVGVQQFVFLPEPFNYLVVGGLITQFDSKGKEFRHRGFEVSAGGETSLFWGIDAGLLYRFQYRNYSEDAFFPTDPERLDHEHQVSFSLNRPFGRHLNASIEGSYRLISSNISRYDIDRFVVGTYLTYAF